MWHETIQLEDTRNAFRLQKHTKWMSKTKLKISLNVMGHRLDVCAHTC